MRAGLICHSNVEHGKMVKKYTLNIDKTQSEYSILIVIIISTFLKLKMSWKSYNGTTTYIDKPIMDVAG